MKWIKDKVISYFGVKDDRTTFLNNWFDTEIAKPAEINMALGISLNMQNLLYDFLKDKSTIASTFINDYGLWKLIISTKLVSGYNAAITIRPQYRNKFQVEIWKSFNGGINSKKFFTYAFEYDNCNNNYKTLLHRVSKAINDLEEINNQELKKLNDMNQKEEKEEFGYDTNMDLDTVIEFHTCSLPNKDINSINQISLDIEKLLDSKLVLLDDTELEQLIDDNIELFSQPTYTNVIPQMIFQLSILEVILDYLMVKELHLNNEND